MSDLGFSLLPGTANVGNANFSAASPYTSGDMSHFDFSLQSTRKTVEILQAQVQLLSMRVVALENQNALLLTTFQQRPQPNLPGATSPGSGLPVAVNHNNNNNNINNNNNNNNNNSSAVVASGKGGGVASTATGSGNSPFLSTKTRSPGGSDGVPLPPLLDSPSANAKQSEEDPTRLGANLLNSPSQQPNQQQQQPQPQQNQQHLQQQQNLQNLQQQQQQLALADGFAGAGGNPLFASLQQQLAAAMAQHQREEAIAQMLQSSPTTATPTATYPLCFPGTNNNNNNANNNNNNNNNNNRPVSPEANSMANMAYLYSPTSHGGAPGGSPNIPQPLHHLMLPQHNGGTGAPPLFAMNGGNGGGLFGFGAAVSPNSVGGAGGMANNMNLPGGGGGGVVNNMNLQGGGAAAAAAAAAALTTTVTLDPNKGNSNESLDRVCHQPWLKELIMKNCKNISNFAPIARLRNLWKLNLQGCSQHVDDSVVKLIATYNKRLSRLNLCGCEKIGNATALQNLNFLFDLNLSGCNIGNDSLEAVASGCQQLSRLAINSCPLVTDISSLRRLKELKLLYCRYSGHISPASIVQLLHEIGSGLLTLNVDGVKFSQLPNLAGPDAATGASLPLPLALKNLNMKDNTELTSLAWLTGFPGAEKYFPSLEMLDVEGCSNLAQLGSLAVFPNLKILRLSKTNIPQEVLETAVARCPNLPTLYLDGCPNIRSVECLAKMPGLRKVIVDQTLNTAPAAANGLTALYQTNHIEVVFANYNNNSNNHHHGAGGGGTSMTPSGSPTSNFVPAMPTGDKK